MSSGRPYRGAIVIAPPGAIGAWATRAIREAAAGCDRPLDVRVIDRHEDIEPGRAAHCIFLAQYPGPAVMGIVAAGTLPVVAFIDDAANAVDYMMRSAGCDFLQAMRLTTCAAAVNPQLLDGVSVRIIRRGPAVDAARTLDALVDHLALPITGLGLQALKRQFARDHAGAETLEASCARLVEGCRDIAAASDLTDDQLRCVAAALAPMVAIGNGARDGAITWPTSLFLYGDRPNETAPLVADMTGAARIIYYGPYLYLPQGDWDAEITVGFSKDAVGSRFSVEVHGAELVARATFEARQTGLFSGAFRFTHARPQDHLELRFRNDQGAIEGRFGLAWVKFVRTHAQATHSVA